MSSVNSPYGVSWLPAVPSHWRLEPLHAVLSPKTVSNKGNVEATVLSLSHGRIVVKAPEDLRGLVPESFETYQIVEPNDIIIRVTDLQNDQKSLRVGRVEDRGIITSAYLCLQARAHLNPEYAYWVLTAYDLMKVFYGYGSGLRQNLDFRHIKRMPIGLPPSGEQVALAEYLQDADDLVNRAIAEKARLIDLLYEDSMTVASRYVLSGSSDGRPSRESGLTWLGPIPQGWNLVPARYLFRAVVRRDISPDDPKLSVTQRRGLVPTDEMTESSTQAESYERFQVCHPRDLVLNKYKAHLGVFWAAKQRGLITPNYTVFRPLGELEPEYFELLFHTPAYRSVFKMTVYGVTEGMSPLYTQDFYRIPVLVPPIRDQQSIVERVAATSAGARRTIALVEREIQLLREYRNRLVVEVVLGRLDASSLERRVQAIHRAGLKEGAELAAMDGGSPAKLHAGVSM